MHLSNQNNSNQEISMNVQNQEISMNVQNREFSMNVHDYVKYLKFLIANARIFDSVKHTLLNVKVIHKSHFFYDDITEYRYIEHLVDYYCQNYLVWCLDDNFKNLPKIIENWTNYVSIRNWTNYLSGSKVPEYDEYLYNFFVKFFKYVFEKTHDDTSYYLYEQLTLKMNLPVDPKIVVMRSQFISNELINSGYLQNDQECHKLQCLAQILKKIEKTCIRYSSDKPNSGNFTPEHVKEIFVKEFNEHDCKEIFVQLYHFIDLPNNSNLVKVFKEIYMEFRNDLLDKKDDLVNKYGRSAIRFVASNEKILMIVIPNTTQQ